MSIKINEKDHVQGNENAKIELIEYGDYECPYCGEAYPIIKKVQKELGNNLKFIFRNFPLVEMHPFALHAAIASEAAAEQGKFWEMHDILYENQKNLKDSDLIKYAEKIDLDVSKFEEDFNSNNIYQKIKEDFDSGVKNEIQGTPAFFINGKPFEGNWMDTEFIEYLKSLLK